MMADGKGGTHGRQAARLAASYACSQLLVAAAACSDVTLFPSVTNTWSLTDSAIVGAVMTLDVRTTSNACALRAVFKSIAHRPSTARSVRVSGGLSGGTTSSLEHRLYDDDGWTMLEVQFGQVLGVHDTFHVRVEYELVSPVCAVERALLRFEEDWSHKWRVPANVGELDYNLCAEWGTPSLRSSSFGAGAPKRPACLTWRRSAPSTGASFDVALLDGRSAPFGVRSCGYVHPGLIGIVVACVVASCIAVGTTVMCCSNGQHCLHAAREVIHNGALVSIARFGDKTRPPPSVPPPVYGEQGSSGWPQRQPSERQPEPPPPPYPGTA
mmetsp:Transcript_25061/g.64719  ORF Transcript_25061/g.64719 Transcript_25061/m.64719 type:complete len:326 (+) Transcript_25061:10-987(+)